MIIAVDFDGTVVEHRYPKIGKPIPFAIETLKMLQRDRHLLILWTVREGALLQEAIDYCRERGVEFYAHNSNYAEEQNKPGHHFSRKLKADLFIDDRNVGGLLDWNVVYEMVKSGETSESYYSRMALEDGYEEEEKPGFWGRLFGRK